MERGRGIDGERQEREGGGAQKFTAADSLPELNPLMLCCKSLREGGGREDERR